MGWYVVEAFEGKDFEAQLRLAAAGLDVWRPVHRIEIEKHVRVGGYDRRVKSFRNVARFGRYLFLNVMMSDAINQAVRHTTGVKQFLTLAGSDAPAEIDSRMIAFLRTPPVETTKEIFHKGDIVEFKAGPFVNQLGEIEQVDKPGSVLVTISAFGGASIPIDTCYLELRERRKRPKESREKRRTKRHSIAHAQ